MEISPVVLRRADAYRDTIRLLQIGSIYALQRVEDHGGPQETYTIYYQTLEEAERLLDGIIRDAPRFIETENVFAG